MKHLHSSPGSTADPQAAIKEPAFCLSPGPKVSYSLSVLEMARSRLQEGDLDKTMPQTALPQSFGQIFGVHCTEIPNFSQFLELLK